MKRSAICVDLKEELRARVQKIADENGVSLTYVVKLAMEAGLPKAAETIEAVRRLESAIEKPRKVARTA